MKISKKAYAKINITLDVLGKRDDGYHDIVSIMQTVTLCDIVSIKKMTEGINVSWNARGRCNERNTAYKAADLMFKTFNLDGGVNIFIEKRIPIAAGLGGGSADAAAVISGINEMYELNLKREELLDLGMKIGADVPFCIVKGTAVAEGIGERLVQIDAKIKGFVLLVKPTMSISTREVYSKIDSMILLRRPDTNMAIEALRAADFNNLGQNLYNVMEAVTAGENPIIPIIKQKMLMQGASGALMSGSGPTVYGIFKNRILAENAYNYFKANGGGFDSSGPLHVYFSEFYFPDKSCYTGGN